MKYTTTFLFTLGLVFSCSQNTELKQSEIEQIEQLEKDYVNGWFAETPQEAVLEVFEENVVFIPHHGDDAVIGKENLRDFFWPNGTGGIVHYFNHYPDTIEGNQSIAWVRGRFDIKYSWIEELDTVTTLNEGNYVLIARKNKQDWKIATFIFNDPVAQVEE